jgi:LmbE family N-acetylglucosaminyl deacetylase
MNKLLYLAVFSLFINCRTAKPVSYTEIKSMQDYSVPLDQPFESADAKRALFVFPHPDDEIAHAGTIAYLRSIGTEVRLITLAKGVGEDAKIRPGELLCAVDKLGVSSFRQYDFYNNTWEAVLKNEIKYWQGDSLLAIQKVIENEIMSFKPTLIYTYDTIIGGYGHQEHLLTAKSVFNGVASLGENASFVKKIYMSTLPPGLEKFLCAKVASYPSFVKRAGRGLPAPQVAYDIKPFWPVKKEAAMCHVSQEHVMRNFYLKPKDNDSLHYDTFDREYYVVSKR